MVAAFCVQVFEIAFLVAFGLGPELKPFGTESQLMSKTGGASVVFVWEQLTKLWRIMITSEFKPFCHHLFKCLEDQVHGIPMQVD